MKKELNPELQNRPLAEDLLADAHPTGEQVFRGKGVSPGIAIGPVYLYAPTSFKIEQREIAEEEVLAEVERFEWAISRSERDLNKIITIAREKLGMESADIFEAQLLMLRDEELYHAVLNGIRTNRYNADYSVKHIVSIHRQRLEASDNEYLRERANDLLDVQNRIITHLCRGRHLSAIETDVIVVAENLTAADIVLFSRRGILGCALDQGGATSHVSIMARALGVPAVMSLHGITAQVEPEDLVIVDGHEGVIILNPEEETLARYRQRQEKYRQLHQEQKQLAPLPADTLDRHHMHLRANVEFMEELETLGEYGAEGIGLLRTEVLLLMKGKVRLTEEEQYSTYKEIVQRVQPATTTFRMLDLGGDKMLPFAHREHNPFLGWRGIRVLFDKSDIMMPQLRALLRASVHGPIRILLPMVTHLEEVHLFKGIYQEAREQLQREQYPVAEDIPIGIMVEVPSVALMADRFAAEVDFFSIGTNDLTQYTLAVDRGNDLVASLYQELHPAVLALIKRTVDAGKEHGISVGLCGEMGGNARYAPVLVGLGLDELSASPTYLPEVKSAIRMMKRTDAQALAAEILAATTAKEASELLNAWLAKNAPTLVDLMS